MHSETFPYIMASIEPTSLNMQHAFFETVGEILVHMGVIVMRFEYLHFIKEH